MLGKWIRIEDGNNLDLNGDGHYIYHTKDGDYFLKMDGLSDEVIKGIDGVLDIDDSLDVGEFLYITKEEIKDNFSDEDNCIYIVEVNIPHRIDHQHRSD